MKLADVMMRPVRTLRPDDSLDFARSLFVWAGIHHAPVLEGEDLIGLLSDRDLAWHIARHQGLDLTRAMVADAMDKRFPTAGPEISLTEAAARMVDRHLECLLVTQRGKLIGIVTVTDILAGEVRQSTIAPRVSEPSVGDVMSADPVVAHPGESLLQAADRMRARGVRHLPVVNGDGRAIGMLSDRDIRQTVGDLRRLGSADPDLSLLRVGEVMSEPLLSVSDKSPLSEAARYFSDFSISALAVVGEGGVLVGVVSYIDVVQGLVAATR